MTDRRRFCLNVATATAGVLLAGGSAAEAVARALQGAAAAAKRREVMVGGRRIKVVDIHAHVLVPDVFEVVKDTKLAASASPKASGNQLVGPERISAMDGRGIDVQVLSINGYWWYAADRDLARQIVRVHDEKLAAWSAAYPGRFVPLTSVAMQFPDLAAEQLEYAVTKLGMRGASIGGHVQGEDLALPKFDPFWAKLQELNVPVFMHPNEASSLVREGALAGRGALGNIVGNPLETTVFLSRLILGGTLDRYPGVRVVASHAGGYLPSYLGRSEVSCDVRPDANCANKKRLTEYLKREILVDSMVLSEEGLRHLVAVVGVGQILYGTDIPFNWPDSVDMILKAPFLNDAQREAILGGNLMRLLRIT